MGVSGVQGLSGSMGNAAMYNPSDMVVGLMFAIDDDRRFRKGIRKSWVPLLFENIILFTLILFAGSVTKMLTSVGTDIRQA